MSDEANTLYYVDGELVDAWGNVHDESELSGGGVDYSTWSAKELKAEIDNRNSARSDETDHIVLEDNKKSTAAAALQADDEAHADEEE